MGCAQSDSIPVPFWKPATVLKIETIQGWDALESCAVIYRRDSKGAYESILASCLEVRVVR